MAVNGITDIVTTVTVSKSEYESLIRESETLAIMKAVIRTQKYVNDDVTRQILGVELEENGGNE